MRVAVLIPAAGASSRYSTDPAFPRSKLDEDLGGKPLLQRTIEIFTKAMSDDWTLTPIIVAGPADPERFAQFRQRHADRLSIMGAQLCPGGPTHRWESVRAALSLVPDTATHVAVHDAARPCLGHDLLDRVLAAASRHDAVIPAMDVSDTLKRGREVESSDAPFDPAAALLGETAPSRPRTLNVVDSTVDRTSVYGAQTPQVFNADVLRRAFSDENIRRAASRPGGITDDASLVESLFAAEGAGQVVIVEGDSRNVKVTRPNDLRLARSILGLKESEGRPVHMRF